MRKSYIQAIEYVLPAGTESNDPDDKLTEKIGIRTRHVTSEGEYASDLAVAAADKLFASGVVVREEIDFLVYCTQSPDYLLPTTACILQDRLGLPTTCGAFDFNLGCSGFVYGLSLAKGLIETGSASKVLLLTADTYSKYANPKDRSVRPLFGDAAAATLIGSVDISDGTSSDSSADFIGPFVFGTDGRGARNLIVPVGGLRESIGDDTYVETTDNFGNVRHAANLYMNGPEVFNFTLKAVPPAFRQLLEVSGRTKEAYDGFVFHQANGYMLEHLRKKLDIPNEKFFLELESCGNTVSSTIPIALKAESERRGLPDGALLMLMGFGVGYSWAACNVIWKAN